nr:extensin-like [Lolium perenne]
MATQAPVVEITDDDDDVPAAFTPARPRNRKRPRATATPSTAAASRSTPPDFLGAFSPTPPATSSRDFVGAFCPSPIRPWNQRVSATPTSHDDTPPPPKRRPSAPPIILDDDDDTPTSPYVSETPDNVAAGTPGFTTPRPATGPSSAAPVFSSTGRVPASSGEVSSPLSLVAD